jgi:hypothetical protein
VLLASQALPGLLRMKLIDLISKKLLPSPLRFIVKGDMS